MAVVTNRASLRANVKDWLNRADLIDTQVDQFIEMGEAKIYEELRVPSLEKSVNITVSNSRINIPYDFLELIEIRKTGPGSCSVVGNDTPAACATAGGIWSSLSENDDIILARTDTRNLYASNKHAIANSFARDGAQWVITNTSGSINATGPYIVRYYKVDSAIGSVYTLNDEFRSTSAECALLTRQSDDTISGADFEPYASVNGYGTCTIGYSDVEKQPWLLGDYEIVLFAACSIASEYLGNDEDVARYTRLYLEKLRVTNMRAASAELKGANVSMAFRNFQGL